MSTPKRRGGMGFRNFYAFNQALLAKQAWRILTNPTSLCARVLQARYFKGGGFLSASCPGAASYTWRSIMHGRNLLQEGLIWRIGNGTSVDVWRDRWIPREGLQCPLGHKPHTSVSKVEELLLPDGQGWNEAKLNELFYESDVEDIMKISVGRAGTEDYIAWNQTKNGIFSVKSAYHLNMRLKERRANRAGSSRSCEEHRGWLSLWSADVPGKARIHVWRMIKNGLAVGSELERRNIKPGVKCIACHRDETLLHRFWLCPHSVAIWEKVRAVSGLQLSGPRLTSHRPSELGSWLLDWLGRLPDKELSVGMMVL
jgi:hypothetical protein